MLLAVSKLQMLKSLASSFLLNDSLKSKLHGKTELKDKVCFEAENFLKSRNKILDNRHLP